MESFQGRCEIRKYCELTVWEKSTHSEQKAKFSLWDVEGNQDKKKKPNSILLAQHACLFSFCCGKMNNEYYFTCSKLGVVF